MLAMNHANSTAPEQRENEEKQYSIMMDDALVLRKLGDLVNRRRRWIRHLAHNATFTSAQRLTQLSGFVSQSKTKEKEMKLFMKRFC